MATPVKRIRRTPEEARRVILDAAEQSMAAHGPSGIRLQDVAAAAGVSHPTILHHFGSREGLILALNRRTLEDLKRVLLANMASASSSDSAVSSAFAAYRNGLAQRMIWLLQTQTEYGAAGLPLFDEIVDSLHALRVGLAAPGVAVDRYDSQAIVHLTTIAALGDAIVGPRLRRGQDAQEELQARQRFETWLGALLNGFIMGRAHPSA